MIKIRHRETGEVLYVHKGDTLAGAALCGFDLRYANLSRRDLHCVDASYANLDYADFRGADMGGICLRHASLRGIRVNWSSHDLLAEILRRKTGDDAGKRMLAGLVLISRDWCWNNFLSLDHPEKAWAIDVLAKYVHDDDIIPESLREYIDRKGQP